MAHWSLFEEPLPIWLDTNSREEMDNALRYYRPKIDKLIEAGIHPVGYYKVWFHLYHTLSFRISTLQHLSYLRFFEAPRTKDGVRLYYNDPPHREVEWNMKELPPTDDQPPPTTGYLAAGDDKSDYYGPSQGPFSGKGGRGRVGIVKKKKQRKAKEAQEEEESDDDDDDNDNE